MEEPISQLEQYGVRSGGINAGKQHDDVPPRPQYSMPGILHFLQTEWARFEMDRAQWEVDRAELQARIAFLQGERKGQENLKRDLVRRIKMLEFALKQERSKYHKLKYGTDLDLGDMTPPSFDKDAKDDQSAVDSVPTSNANGTWKQGRQLLRQYLQEIGYTDTIIDVRSVRVRQLLGLPPLADSAAVVNGEPQQAAGKKTDEVQPRRTNAKKMPVSLAESALLSTEESIMATFDFLASENVVDEEAMSDGENDDGLADDDNTDDRLLVRRSKMKSGELTVGGDELMSDADTEEALAEFDFLVSVSHDGAGEARSHADTDWEKKDTLTAEEWSVDQQMLSKLKEQYKRERHRDTKSGAAGSGHISDRPKRSTLQAMLVNLDGEDDVPALQSGSHSPPRTGNADIDDNSPRKAMMDVLGGDEDALEAALGLGELAGLTVTNEADAYDVSSSKDVHRRTWNAKYTLRSHFDGIRALVFHPVEPVLITASEDHMLKLWNLQKTVPAKKAASLDVEPVYTFRAHEGPVLSLAMSPTGECCYSGGMDGTICCWNIPNSNIDPYDSFDPSVLQATLVGHSDAIWGLSMHNSKMHLLSCSSDATVRLWNPNVKSPLLSTFKIDTETGVPTSVDFVQCEPTQLVVAYTSANAYVFDIEKSKPVIALDYKPSSEYSVRSQVNRIVCHPTLPVTITAHEDRHIRFFDNNSGKVIHSMVAHLDAVTSLAIDPSGLYLLSGSHDCSIRLWNLDSKTCVQEITSHRKKFDESIHDVAFHPSKPFIASAGADALAKVFA